MVNIGIIISYTEIAKRMEHLHQQCLPKSTVCFRYDCVVCACACGRVCVYFSLVQTGPVVHNMRIRQIETRVHVLVKRAYSFEACENRSPKTVDPEARTSTTCNRLFPVDVIISFTRPRRRNCTPLRR